MTFQEEMKNKRKSALELISKGTDNRSLDEKATQIIEDYILPMIRLDLLFDPDRELWNVEFHHNSDGVWFHGNPSNNMQMPFSTEALIEATQKANNYGLIGINRYESDDYFSFTLLLVDKSEIKSVYERVRFLGEY